MLFILLREKFRFYIFHCSPRCGSLVFILWYVYLFFGIVAPIFLLLTVGVIIYFTLWSCMVRLPYFRFLLFNSVLKVGEKSALCKNFWSLQHFLQGWAYLLDVAYIITHFFLKYFKIFSSTFFLLVLLFIDFSYGMFFCVTLSCIFGNERYFFV